jgi:hypothetical protein
MMDSMKYRKLFLPVLTMLALSGGLTGCDGSSHPAEPSKSIQGSWTASGRAVGEMHFEPAGVLRAGLKDHLSEIGKWAQSSDELTLDTGGSAKKARLDWQTDGTVKLIPLDSHGEGPPILLTPIKQDTPKP